MERHGIEWEQLGTHDEHLSVFNYKKEQRAKEVDALESEIKSKETNLSVLSDKSIEVQNEVNKSLIKLEKTQDQLKSLKEIGNIIINDAREYDENPDYQLPEPKPLKQQNHITIIMQHY